MVCGLAMKSKEKLLDGAELVPAFMALQPLRMLQEEGNYLRSSESLSYML